MGVFSSNCSNFVSRVWVPSSPTTTFALLNNDIYNIHFAALILKKKQARNRCSFRVISFAFSTLEKALYFDFMFSAKVVKATLFGVALSNIATLDPPTSLHTGIFTGFTTPEMDPVCCRKIIIGNVHPYRYHPQNDASGNSCSFISDIFKAALHTIKDRKVS